MMDNPKIQARIAELRAPIIAQAQYSLTQAMAEAERALRLAEQEENPGAMIAAIQLRAKLNGLLVEDRRNARRPLQDASDEELDAIIRQAQAELARESLH